MKTLLSSLLVSAATVAAIAAPDPEAFSYDEKKIDAARYAGLFPPQVKTIAVISPASVPDSKNVRLNVRMLEKAGLRVKLGKHALEPAAPGAKSAPLAHRVEDFMAAWNDPEVDMIICTRGGTGSAELIEQLDWEAMKKRPDLPFQGYSDITLILCSLLSQKAGHPYTGPMVGALHSITDESIGVMRDTLQGKEVAPVSLKPLVPGDCRGKVLAGHLQRFAVIAKTRFRPETKDCILFIECVNRTPEEIRGYLAELREAGFFTGVAGVVFCHFTRCGKPAEIDAIQKEFAETAKIPVYRGFPYGHEKNSHVMDFRSTAVIENNAVRFLITGI